MFIIARLENKKVKQLLHIENKFTGNDSQVLSLCVGQKHAGFAITSKSGLDLFQLAVCSADDPIGIGWNEKELTEFFAAYPMLNNIFYKVNLSYDFPESMFISSLEYKQKDSGLLLNTLYGNSANALVIAELIAEWQLYNIYAVPKNIGDWLGDKFPTAKCSHQYSLSIKNINTAADNGCLLIDFRKDDFTLIVSKGNQFLLAQTFDYATPGDVIYALLKTCQQFSLSQQLVQVKLTGLIDIQSNLYKELYKYFYMISFREANWQAGNEFPAHFFTLLNDLAICAS